MGKYRENGKQVNVRSLTSWQNKLKHIKVYKYKHFLKEKTMN